MTVTMSCEWIVYLCTHYDFKKYLLSREKPHGGCGPMGCILIETSLECSTESFALY